MSAVLPPAGTGSGLIVSSTVGPPPAHPAPHGLAPAGPGAPAAWRSAGSPGIGSTGSGHEVSVDVDGDLDGPMPKPAGDLMDGDAVCERRRGEEVPQSARRVLRPTLAAHQPCGEASFPEVVVVRRRGGHHSLTAVAECEEHRQLPMLAGRTGEVNGRRRRSEAHNNDIRASRHCSVGFASSSYRAPSSYAYDGKITPAKNLFDPHVP